MANEPPPSFIFDSLDSMSLPWMFSFCNFNNFAYFRTYDTTYYYFLGHNLLHFVYLNRLLL